MNKIIYPTEHYLVGFRSHPIIAIPNIAKSSKLKSIDFYPAQTWKKKLFKKALSYCFSLGLERLFYNQKTNFSHLNYTFSFDRWLEHVCQQLLLPRNYFTVVWPPDIKRQRLYIYFFDELNILKAFGKFSLDSENNKRIKNEFETLSFLNEQKLSLSKVPNILLEGLWEDNYYLVTQPFPEHSKLVNSSQDIFPKKCIAEYSGSLKPLILEQFEKSYWWRDFCDRKNEVPILAQEIEKITRAGIKTCRVHGDLGSTNIFKHKDDLWLIDWERSAADGPILVDDVGFYIGTHHAEIKRNRKVSFNKFKQKYLDNDFYNRNDVLMALAFLHGAEFRLATALIKKWEKEK